MELAAAQFGRTYLLDRFRAFYAEVVAARGELAAVDALPAAEAEAGERSDPVAAVSQRLAALLERDAGEALRLGGALGGRLFREAQFVMAALGDEILLHGPAWRGRDRWQSALLETRLFNSQDAGERFFDKLDQLLQTRDPVEEQLAVIYLFALRLGFEGKYRGLDARPDLDRYRQRLFEFIAHRAPDVSRPASPPFFPRAYDYTLERHKTKTLPLVWGWLLALAAVVLLWIIGSHIAWTALTDPVMAVIDGATGAAPILAGTR